MIDLKVHNGLPTAEPFEITDHFGLPMLILPEVANMLQIEPGHKLADAAQFWQVVNNNSLATIAYLRATEAKMLANVEAGIKEMEEWDRLTELGEHANL